MVRTREGFNHKAVFILACFQLICGSSAIILGIIQSLIKSQLGNIGYGIWTGFIFLVAGIIGITSWKYKSTCNIIWLMVMSVIASVFGFILLVCSSISLTQDMGYQTRLVTYNKCVARYPLLDSPYYHPFYECGDEPYCYIFCTYAVPLEAILIFISVLQMIVAIITPAYCCKAVCCVARPTNQAQAIRYLSPSTGQAGPQVIIMATGTGVQQGYAMYPNQQPAVYMQAPPQYPTQGQQQWTVGATPQATGLVENPPAYTSLDILHTDRTP